MRMELNNNESIADWTDYSISNARTAKMNGSDIAMLYIVRLFTNRDTDR